VVVKVLIICCFGHFFQVQKFLISHRIEITNQLLSNTRLDQDCVGSQSFLLLSFIETEINPAFSLPLLGLIVEYCRLLYVDAINFVVFTFLILRFYI
jgi:hypothetical protein